MRIIRKGATSQTIYLSVNDSASTTGGKKTGIAFNSSGIVASYTRNGAARTAITLATQTASGAWSSGGWVEVDATNEPGLYRFDVPDAAFASGVDSVVIQVRGVTGMVDAVEEVQLTAVDLQDATAMGVSRIDAAITSRMATFTLPTNFSSLAINGSGRVDLGTWLGVAPNALTQGRVDALIEVRTGTAQAGAAGSITLDAGASATDNLYATEFIVILAGTGAGQTRIITGYTGSTKVATVTPSWTTNPDNTSVFAVIPSGRIDVALWLGSNPNVLVSGRVDSSVGAMATDVLTSGALATTAVTEITTAVVDQSLSGHTTGGTVGGALNSASSAGDPWNTALPGAYAGGTAGNIIGNRVDAAISSRMATFTLPTNFSSLAIDGSGRVTVGSIVNGAIAAATFAANALDAVWSAVTRTITGGTITTNSDKTGYSLANGSIAAATFAAGAIDANAIATDAIGSAELAASAVTEIAAGVSVGSAPTAAQNAAAVWDLAISGHTTSGTFGAKLNGLSGASGSGAIDVTVSVTSGGNPVDGALVWITTDAAGTNTVASSTTIANGTCHVFLDSGTYYSWAQRGGINFLEGASFTV